MRPLTGHAWPLGRCFAEGDRVMAVEMEAVT